MPLRERFGADVKEKYLSKMNGYVSLAFRSRPGTSEEGRKNGDRIVTHDDDDKQQVSVLLFLSRRSLRSACGGACLPA